jgi:hypothetical protein
MWYLPSVTAVIVIFAGSGMNAVLPERSPWLTAIPPLMLLMYALHLPSTIVLNERVQTDIEFGVRREVGGYLDQVMAPEDRVVLEPVGYIGWQAFNKTILDYPGLTSEIATDALEGLPKADRTMLSLIDVTRPEYVVLRRGELEAFQTFSPDVAREYQSIQEFKARPDLSLSWGGTSYFNIDTDFVVLRRVDLTQD